MSFQTISSVNYISGLFYCFICCMLQNKHYTVCYKRIMVYISNNDEYPDKQDVQTKFLLVKLYAVNLSAFCKAIG